MNIFGDIRKENDLRKVNDKEKHDCDWVLACCRKIGKVLCSEKQSKSICNLFSPNHVI